MKKEKRDILMEIREGFAALADERMGENHPDPPCRGHKTHTHGHS